jgi:NADH-quinone oxidoreductase subunit J
MHSALWLFVTLLGLAGIYLLLGAEFVAAIQVIVYAGGVLVLYIFVIMLMDLSKESALRGVFHKPTQWVPSLAMAILVMAIILIERHSDFITDMGRNMSADETRTFTVDTTRELAKELFLTYLYPFEVASILLLVAMIGAVVLARRSAPAAESETEEDS